MKKQAMKARAAKTAATFKSEFPNEDPSLSWLAEAASLDGIPDAMRESYFAEVRTAVASKPSTGVPRPRQRAPRGSRCRLSGLTVDVGTADFLERLAAAMKTAGMDRPHPSGALDLLVSAPGRAHALLAPGPTPLVAEAFATARKAVDGCLGSFRVLVGLGHRSDGSVEAFVAQARESIALLEHHLGATARVLRKVVGETREDWDGWEDGEGNNLGAEIAAALTGSPDVFTLEEVAAEMQRAGVGNRERAAVCAGLEGRSNTRGWR